MSRIGTPTEKMSATDKKSNIAVAIYNGPSREAFKGLKLSCPVIGCNFAYRDFAITDCVAVDRMAVAAIRSEHAGVPYPFRCWTKRSSLPLPDGWQDFVAPGIDSGSMAVALALSLSEQVIVIGCDGVMGGSTDSAYDYRWHRNHKNPRIHIRHGNHLQQLIKDNPGRIHLVWPGNQPEMISQDQALRLLGKYVITEAA